MKDHADVHVKPPLLFLAGTLLGYVTQGVYPWSIPNIPFLWGIGVGMGLGAFALILWAVRLFQRAGTPIQPWKPTHILVTSGPYRFTRNPMYLALTLLQTGLAFLFNTMWILLALIPVLILLHFLVIRKEETYLDARFGEEYRDYKRRVRRWI